MVALACALGLVWLLTDAPDPGPAAAPARAEAEPDPLPPAPPDLSGRVVDRDTGRPVPEALVLARCDDTDELFEALADEEGVFGLAGLPPALCRLAAEAEGHVPGGPIGGRPLEVRVDPERPRDGLRLALSRAASISGRVTDGSRPVAGVTLTIVYLEATEEPESFSVTVERTTDSRGRFVLPELTPGRVQLLAEHQTHGFVETEDAYLRPGEARTGLEIVMASGGSLVGRVIDQRRRAVSGARVRVFAEGARRAQVVTTDEDGGFFLEQIAAGEARLVASAVGFDAAEHVTVEVEVGEEVEVVLALAAAPGFGGVVLQPDGAPARWASIYMARQGDSAAVHRSRPISRTDAEGRFYVSGVQSYPVEVWADHRSYGRTDSAVVRADGADVTLRLQPGTRLIGRLVDPRGRPVTSYQLSLSPAQGSRHSRLALRDVSDPDGRFVVESISPGSYRLVFRAPGFTPLTTDVLEVPEGAETDAGTFVARPGGGAVGRVTDATTGDPLQGARVQASTDDSTLYGGAVVSARTDEEGWFRIEGLPTSRLSLQVSRGGYVQRLVSAVQVPGGGETDVGTIALTPAEDGRRRMQYSGVGARVQMSDDGLVLAGIFDGSPAADAGLESGTTVLTINGQDTTEMSLRQAVELIRGESGTDVELQVIRPGSDYPEMVAVERGDVVTP